MSCENDDSHQEDYCDHCSTCHICVQGSEAEYSDIIAELKAENEQLKEMCTQLGASKKKAFWWSAEFTHIVHGGKIQKAWNDYLSIEASKLIEKIKAKG